MAEKNLHHLREHYDKHNLNPDNVSDNPFEQFDEWFEQALTNHSYEANTMTLATSSTDAQPSCRIVLLKEYSPSKGFVFFTNYTSQKGQDLLHNPKACIMFFWPEDHRQVRINGIIEKVSVEDSEAYFYKRPIDSQIGAMISPQSQSIEEGFLENSFSKAKTENEIMKPVNWGGYALKANYFEFWQGKPNRLHDRITYTLQNTNWNIERIAP